MQPYMGYQWLSIEGDTVTVGLSEEGLEDFESISAVDLPQENEEVSADEVCCSIETDEGPLDIYCPVEGKIIEINPSVQDDPSLIFDDPTGEGWLFKIEANDPEELSIALQNDDE